MASYLEMLTQAPPKKSRREEMLRLALQILTLSMDEGDDTNDAGFAMKDGTGPEIYVAPRISPSP